MKGSRKLGREERVLWGKVAKTTRPISGDWKICWLSMT